MFGFIQEIFVPVQAHTHWPCWAAVNQKRPLLINSQWGRVFLESHRLRSSWTDESLWMMTHSQVSLEDWSLVNYACLIFSLKATFHLWVLSSKGHIKFAQEMHISISLCFELNIKRKAFKISDDRQSWKLDVGAGFHTALSNRRGILTFLTFNTHTPSLTYISDECHIFS